MVLRLAYIFLPPPRYVDFEILYYILDYDFY